LNISLGSIKKPNPYPKAIPTAVIVLGKHPTEPDNYFGVTPYIYFGTRPELNPTIIPIINLPINKVKNERLIHCIAILKIAAKSNKIINILGLIFKINLNNR
jgi:hypothetical protein